MTAPEGDPVLLDNLRLSVHVLTAEKALGALQEGLMARFGDDAVVVRAAENASLALAAVKEMIRKQIQPEP